VLEPRAVLLDEPLSNLDVPLSREISALFRELLSERASAALFVTHDLRQARRLARRIAVLEGGRISANGTLEELRAGPKSEFVASLIADLDGE
jgi:iron(III) transport system ATP-binding protein